MAKTKSKKIPKKFLAGFKPNFDTLMKACRNNDLALMECMDLKTNKKVAMICAVHFDGMNYQFTPLGTMNEGNPYERFSPPNPEGGFFALESNKPVPLRRPNENCGHCNHSPCICKGKQ